LGQKEALNGCEIATFYFILTVEKILVKGETKLGNSGNWIKKGEGTWFAPSPWY